MQIGGFYGLTAPIFVALCDDDLRKALSEFNTTLNVRNALDIKKEFFHFAKSVSNLPFQYELNSKVLNEYEKSVTVVDGNLQGTGLHSEELKDELMYALVDNCGIKLLSAIEKDNSIDCSRFEDSSTFMQNMIDAVKEAMSGKSFSLDKVNVLTNNFIRKLKSEEPYGNTEKVSANIKAYCDIKLAFPDKLILNNKEVTVTDNEKKVLTFYYKRCELIQDLMKEVQLVEFSENVVFNIPFLDFLNRKPTSLYYLVSGCFDQLKNSDMDMLYSVVNYAKNEYTKCKRLIDEKLLKVEGQQDLITAENIDSFSLNNELNSFAYTLFSKFNFREISLPDLIRLHCIYNVTVQANLANLNGIWETNFTLEQFDKLTKLCNELGMGGLNLFSRELFDDSLGEILFTKDDHVYKSDEYLQELLQVCDDIEAFLSTFKPIGGELFV